MTHIDLAATSRSSDATILYICGVEQAEAVPGPRSKDDDLNLLLVQVLAIDIVIASFSAAPTEKDFDQAALSHIYEGRMMMSFLYGQHC